MLFISRCFVLITATAYICFAQVPAIVPLVIPTSGQWDGIDGPWSTFNLGVGNPVQLFRCVPGISEPVVMLPFESTGCNSTTVGPCRERETFLPDNSKSWNTTGLYRAPENNLDDFAVEVSATWGVDDVLFGNNALRDIGSTSQYVTLIQSLDFFVGIFGLAVGSISPTGVAKSTLLSAFAGANTIPSNSFSYTAGSAKKNTTGSLIFGGYDTSRFDPSTTLSITMPNKLNHSLIVNLVAIHLHGEEDTTWPALASSNPIAVRIDSVLPQMWLPLEACRAFEDAFNLLWNDTAEAYTLSETTHQRLVQLNPSVNFTISTGLNGSKRNFTLPYSAFDLRMGDPPAPYFPLKRANSSMEYILGRVFLQEVHVIVDYERANFSLSQAYSTGSSGYIHPIDKAPNDGASTPNETDSRKEGAHMSSGAYAGIGVSVGIVILMIASMLLAWNKGWGMFRKKPSVPDPIEKAELHGDHEPWIEAMGNERVELPVKPAAEVMGREVTELEAVEASLEAGGLVSPTMDGSDELHELDGERMQQLESSSRQGGGWI